MTRTMRSWVVASAIAAIVTAANASEGAYFSQSWGWVALAFLIPTTFLLILERVTIPGPFRLAFALLMGALVAWIALSSLWSISPASSVREVERGLVYLALAFAVGIVLRRGDARAVAGGVLVGVVFITSYALATRLLPDWLDTYDDPTLPYRLSEPLGYWNALGLLAALGFLVALGFVAQGRTALHSVAAAVALPVLATTLYFTFSRGAWAALVIGFVGTTALDPRRLRLLWSTLAVAPASIACVALASRQSALTTEDSPVADAVREGHRLVLVLAALAVFSGTLAFGARWIARNVPISRRARRVVNVALATLSITGIFVAIVLAGGPSRGLSELKEHFDAPPATHGADLNARLFSVSGNGRSQSIGVAWDTGRERPVFGYGAGSYEYLWYERRPSELIVRDAHSLYAETLSEIGSIGLMLLSLTLATPLVAAFVARRSRVVPAAAGAYLAWAAGSAMDWHWEMVGVTLAAFLVGGSALLAAERGRRAPILDAPRLSLLAVSVVLTVFSLVSLVGNQALFAGREALLRRDWDAALDNGHRAQALLPWSFEPELVLGDAAASLGDRRAALDAYRDAAATDSRNWVVWLRLAQVARGAERSAAYDRVHKLNPLEEDLPGERRASG